MKKTLMASAIAAIGVAWLGASWHAGKKIEQGLQVAVQNISHALQENVLLKPSFVITQYERGLFSSQATLAFKLPQRCGPSQEIVLNEKISHGPFPWPLLKQGKFTPALASSQAVLVENDYTRPWFQGANGVMPLRSATRVSYAQEIQSSYIMAPFSIDTETGVWSASSATMDIQWNSATNTVKLASVVDMLRKRGKHNELNRLRADSFGFHIQGYESEALLQGRGQFFGETSSKLKKVQLLFNRMHVLTLSDYSDISTSKEKDQRVSTQLAVTIGSTKAALGLVLPKTHFTASTENLDSEAFHKLSPFFNDASFVMLALCPGAFSKEPAFTEAEQQQIWTAGLALLSGQPKLSLSPVSISDESGEIRADISAGLIKPAGLSTELSLEEISKRWPRAVNSVDARLSLSEATMTNLVEKSLKSMGPYTMTDPALLRSEAEENVKDFSDQMVAKGLARREDGALISLWRFSEGMLHINDRVIPVAEFPDALLSDIDTAGNDAHDKDSDETGDTTEGETPH